MVKTRREAEAIGLIELLVALLSACDVRVPAIFILAAEIEREAVARQPGMQLVRWSGNSVKRRRVGKVRLGIELGEKENVKVIAAAVRFLRVLVRREEKNLWILAPIGHEGTSAVAVLIDFDHRHARRPRLVGLLANGLHHLIFSLLPQRVMQSQIVAR